MARYTQEWWNYDQSKQYSYLRYHYQWAPYNYDHSDYVIFHDGRYGGGHNSWFYTYPFYNEHIYPPIALDLDGNGLDILDISSGITFDWDGDGISDPTAWIGPNDGFLAIDIGNDGIINQSKELSFVEWAPEAATDLEALRMAFDSNNDGVLDGRDERWNEFRIWQDSNQNGICDDGELKTLSDYNIVGINLSSDTERSAVHEDGTIVYGIGSFIYADGSLGEFGDVGLSYLPSTDGEEDGFYLGLTDQDRFIFKEDFGKAVVLGFDAGEDYDDIIEFRANTFADFEAVLQAATQVGDDVVITLDEDNMLTLSNVQLSQLHHDDFRFAA
jgi:hypothetical protein